ncbi:MAG: hypothetical protein ACTSQS_19215 [Promethearchaeota archaeon]
MTHRKSKGVRVISLNENDSVVAIGKCTRDLEECIN